MPASNELYHAEAALLKSWLSPSFFFNIKSSLFPYLFMFWQVKFFSAGKIEPDQCCNFARAKTKKAPFQIG